ncbi:hypothetical protein B0H14DRAFT_2615723 [Mycena olivaceomarginata]|nr:hypothetical protein B0H14DRAFT_2615723 [Mycena olivaceomarginata]
MPRTLSKHGHGHRLHLLAAKTIRGVPTKMIGPHAALIHPLRGSGEPERSTSAGSGSPRTSVHIRMKSPSRRRESVRETGKEQAVGRRTRNKAGQKHGVERGRAEKDQAKYSEYLDADTAIQVSKEGIHERGEHLRHAIRLYGEDGRASQRHSEARRPIMCANNTQVLVSEEQCGSKEVRDELARHQLIACSRDLAVRVLKVDLLRKSWLLGHWRCNTLVPISPAVLRAAVATATFSQGPIRTAIVHATQNEEGTADERVYRFVQTLDVARLPSAAEPPLWIVYGRPCSESHAVWESIRDLFRNASFTKGLSEFTPIGSPSRSAGSTTRRLALCYICKLDDHRSDTCPYALLPDWLGPNEVIKEGREGVLALTPGKPQARNGGARNNDRSFRRNQRPRRD